MPQKKYEFLIRDAAIRVKYFGSIYSNKNTFRNVLDFVISKFSSHTMELFLIIKQFQHFLTERTIDLLRSTWIKTFFSLSLLQETGSTHISSFVVLEKANSERRRQSHPPAQQEGSWLNPQASL